MSVASTPRPALAAPGPERFFHLFVQDRFDDLPHPLPNRGFQTLPPQTDLAYEPDDVRLLHGVFLLFPIARTAVPGFFNGFEENTPFAFLQKSEQNPFSFWNDVLFTINKA